METMYVKPKAGMKIRRPDTQVLLADEGARVPKNNFWMRRLADGDVVESEEPKQKPSVEKDAVAEEAQAESPRSKKGGGQ